MIKSCLAVLASAMALPLFAGDDTGLAAIVFDDPSQPTKTYSGPVSATGITSSIPAAMLNATSLSLLSPDGTSPALVDLTAGGSLAINAALSDYASGEEASTGRGIVFNGPYGQPEYGEITKTAVTYWRNLQIDDIEEIMGYVKRNSKIYCRGSIISRTTEKIVADFIYYEDTGAYTTGCRVEFLQTGSDVTAKLLKSGFCYCRNLNVKPREMYTQHVLPNTMDDLNDMGGTTIWLCVPMLRSSMKVGGRIATGGAMRLRGASLAVEVADQGVYGLTGTGGVRYVAAPTAASPTLTWDSTMVNTVLGPLVLDGVNANLEDGRLGDHPVVIATNGAVVTAGKATCFSAAGGRTFYIYPGSEIEFKTFDSSDHLYISGGAVKWSCAQGTYVGYVSMANGGKLYGNMFRIGHTRVTAAIVSDGPSGVATTNEVAARIRAYQDNGNNEKMIAFICRSADCLVSGGFESCENGWQTKTIQKYGQNKLIIAAKHATQVTCRVDVVEGPLRVAHKDAVSKLPIDLRADATLEIGAGLPVSMPSLTARNSTGQETSVSKVVLENGASLTLPEDGLAFVNGGTIQIEGEGPDLTPVRIGTSKCLTDAQLASIRWKVNSRPCRVLQDDDGYLRLSGLVIIFR